MASFDLSIGISNDRGSYGLRHRVLILSEQGSDQATWYHSTNVGDLTTGGAFKVQIDEKSLDSHVVDSRFFAGKIAAKDKDKVKDVVQRTPATFCQQWVADVVEALEKESLVSKGTLKKWLVFGFFF
jgi:hypothetical protein